MKYVLTYRAVADFLPLAQQHYPAHSARVDEFARRGDLLMIGTFDEPVNGEAMGVFTTREAAEEFAADDPFVVNGVVADWAVRPGNEGVQP